MIANTSVISLAWRFTRNRLYQIAVTRSLGKTCQFNNEFTSPDNTVEPRIPSYKAKDDEPLHLKKSRLLYQSRKRGMLENCLLLSSFAATYLKDMSEEQVQQYDQLINLPSNDWDLYNWAIGAKSVPVEFDNEVMKLLKEHVKNKDKQLRIQQPDLD